MIIIKNNTDRKYSFIEAWNELIKGNIITSNETNYSYRVDRKNRKIKFFNKSLRTWQTCNYISTDEILSTWTSKAQ